MVVSSVEARVPGKITVHPDILSDTDARLTEMKSPHVPACSSPEIIEMSRELAEKLGKILSATRVLSPELHRKITMVGRNMPSNGLINTP